MMAHSGNGNGYRRNLALAKRLWSGRINREQQHALKSLSETYGLSVAAGDLQLLESRWYVTHSGLLRLASRRRCSGIKTAFQRQLSDSLNNRWVFKAVVYKSPGSAGFSGYGDADPTNTSPLVRGAEMRVAETRAVNRALRKAYGIGLCSVEELGWLTGPPGPAGELKQPARPTNSNGSSNGQPKLRDRLCVLIRQHNLDPTLVKAFAAEFCGTPTLREASRDQVESFISHLATAAKENRDGLVCKLNSLCAACGGEVMRRQIPGLHLNQRGVENRIKGLFLVRVDRAHYRWHPQKPFVEIRFVILEPKPFDGRMFAGRLYCTEKALWKLNGFLRDFGYDAQLLKDDQVDETALSNLRGVIRTSYTTLNGRSYQNLDAFAPEADWELLDCTSLTHSDGPGGNDGL